MDDKDPRYLLMQMLQRAMSQRSKVEPQDVGDGWKLVEEHGPHAKVFQKTLEDGFLSVVIERRHPQRDNNEFPKGRLHLSISHNSFLRTIDGAGLDRAVEGRMPTWEELHEARYKFTPHDTNMAIMFPPKELYVNIHKTCLHLLEIPVSMALDPKKQMGAI